MFTRGTSVEDLCLSCTFSTKYRDLINEVINDYDTGKYFGMNFCKFLHPISVGGVFRWYDGNAKVRL